MAERGPIMTAALARLTPGLAPVALALGVSLLAACAGGATRSVVVDVNRIGMEYISSQIRTFLDDFGYRRARIEDLDGDDGLLIKRTAEVEEMHFRSRRFPERLVVTHLDKRAAKIYVRFTEQRRSRFSEAARAEYDTILAAIVERVGRDHVRVR